MYKHVKLNMSLTEVNTVLQNFLLNCLLLLNGSILMQTLNQESSLFSASQPVSKFCPFSPTHAICATTQFGPLFFCVSMTIVFKLVFLFLCLSLQSTFLIVTNIIFLNIYLYLAAPCFKRLVAPYLT